MRLKGKTFECTLSEAEAYMYGYNSACEVEKPECGNWRQWTHNGNIVAYYENNELHLYF